MRALFGLLAAGAVVAAALYWRSGTSEPFDPYTSDYAPSEAVQRYVWKIESLALQLNIATSRRLGAALKDGDLAAWEQALAPGFEATALGGGEPRGHGPVAWLARTEAYGPLDAARFLAHLRAIRERFAALDTARVHHERLRPRVYGETDGAYAGTCTLHLQGRLRDGRQADFEIECALDLARIPAPDGAGGWLEGLRVVRHEERSCREFLMEDVTERSGIDPLDLTDTWTMEGERASIITHAGSLGSNLLDFDDDGWLDLLICDRRLRLYRGVGGGRFEEVAESAGFPLRSDWLFLGGTVADFDGDGDEDVLLDGVRGPDSRVFAYENKGGYFERRADFEDPGVRISHGAVADYDGDGRVDLYLAVVGEPAPEGRGHRWIGDRTSPESVLLRNEGDWRFRDVTRETGALSGNRDIFGVAWTDLDVDGDPDLVLANHFGDNLVLLNDGGRFTPRGLDDGFGGFSMGIAVGDMDEDGDPDVYLANMGSWAGTRIMENLRPEDYPPGVHAILQDWVTGNVVLENRGGKQSFRRVHEANAGWSYGPAVVDLDGDGRLDLYAPAGFQSVDRGKPDG